MTDDKKAYREDDLTEADRQVLRLYEQTQEPIPWDASDDAVLAFARQIRPPQIGSDESGSDEAGPRQAGEDQAEKTLVPGGPAPLGRTSMDDLLGGDETSSEAENQPPQDEKVVPFARPKRSFVGRIVHSPLTGLAMAASLVLGVFIGQGIDPILGPKEPVFRTVEPRATVDPPPALAEPRGLDRLAEQVAALNCADVSLGVLPGSDLQLEGFVASDEDLASLRGLLADLPKQYKAITTNIAVRPWPFCEALTLLNSHAGGARSGSEAPVIRPLRHGIEFKNGEPIVLEASAAAAGGGYLYVDYLQRDGTVIHMLPTLVKPDNRAEANGRIVIGEGARQYLAGEPYGTDLVIMVQSPEPLFAKPRPEIEPARPYLAALRQALAAQAEAGLSGQILSAHSFLGSSPD